MDEQVLAQHQLDAHVAGEEAVLEVGGVVGAGRQHDDAGRVGGAGRGDRTERVAQPVRVVLDAADVAVLEQLGKDLLHHHAVFQHVADARRRPAVVLQDEELAVGIADQVGADDVDVLPARRIEADHLGPVALRLEDQLLRDDALAEDAAVVVDVVEEEVERLDALEQTGFERLPFRGGDRPRDEVEGENLLDAAAIGIDGEGDALIDEDEVGAGAALLELGGLQAAEAFDDEPGVGVRPAGFGE